MVSYGEAGGFEFLIVCNGSDDSTGIPLAQVAEVALRGIAVDNSRTGDARLKALGLSKGRESKHINTVSFSSIENALSSRKMKVSSSSGKIRIVTVCGLEFLNRAGHRQPQVRSILQSMLAACKQAITSSRVPASAFRAPSQQVLPFVEQPSPVTQASTSMLPCIEELSLRVAHLQSLVEGIYNIVSTRHPLAARYKFLPANVLADIFDVEDHALILSNIQAVADALISKKKVDGYDVQFGPYPDNEPRYSQRLARLIVSCLENKGYRVKHGFLRA